MNKKYRSDRIMQKNILMNFMVFPVGIAKRVKVLEIIDPLEQSICNILLFSTLAKFLEPCERLLAQLKIPPFTPKSWRSPSLFSGYSKHEIVCNIVALLAFYSQFSLYV